MGKQKGDIVLLQKTHTIRDDEKYWIGDWSKTLYMAHGVSNSRVVATLIGAQVNYDFLYEYADPEGIHLIITISINEHKFTICNSYAFNNDIPEFFFRK